MNADPRWVVEHPPPARRDSRFNRKRLQRVELIIGLIEEYGTMRKLVKVAKAISERKYRAPQTVVHIKNIMEGGDDYTDGDVVALRAACDIMRHWMQIDPWWHCENPDAAPGEQVWHLTEFAIRNQHKYAERRSAREEAAMDRAE